MPSARSRLFNLLTRGLMGLIFRDTTRPVTAYRPRMEHMDQAQRKAPPAGIDVVETDAPVCGRWLRNAHATSGQVILYLHGGAFSFRMVHAHTTMVTAFCVEAGVSAFMPWYRLAPEHPFPAAPEDCLAAYRHLLDGGTSATDIVVMGDSAGGNLALSLLHLIKRNGLPMPAGVIALSPITDAAQISATWRLNKAHDPMYAVQGAVNPARWYFQGHNPLDPVISPYYGDFSGFPPLYFIVGSIEALLDDSVGMARKAIDMGIPAKVQIWVGMPHVFALNNLLPETRHARNTIAGWLKDLRNGLPATARQDLYRSCVEVMNVKPLTHQLVRETNDIYLADAGHGEESR